MQHHKIPRGMDGSRPATRTLAHERHGAHVPDRQALRRLIHDEKRVLSVHRQNARCVLGVQAQETRPHAVIQRPSRRRHHRRARLLQECGRWRRRRTRRRWRPSGRRCRRRVTHRTGGLRLERVFRLMRRVFLQLSRRRRGLRHAYRGCLRCVIGCMRR